MPISESNPLLVAIAELLTKSDKSEERIKELTGAVADLLDRVAALEDDTECDCCKQQQQPAPVVKNLCMNCKHAPEYHLVTCSPRGNLSKSYTFLSLKSVYCGKDCVAMDIVECGLYEPKEAA